jgi:hypothetical protein
MVLWCKLMNESTSWRKAEAVRWEEILVVQKATLGVWASDRLGQILCWEKLIYFVN